MIFGDVTNGAGGDIRQATNIARRMVCEWGMSDRIGMVEYGKHEDYVFLGRDLGSERGYSEATAQSIDSEVKKLCDDAYSRATDLLTRHRTSLELIAKALLEYETLDGSQVREILKDGRMTNPPGGTPPPMSELPKPQHGGTTIAPEFPHGLTEAPA